jgi:hypothetical protein
MGRDGHGYAGGRALDLARRPPARAYAASPHAGTTSAATARQTVFAAFPLVSTRFRQPRRDFAPVIVHID